jgi:N-glycosylase/DNA lyase
MFNKFWKFFLKAAEISSYKRILREYHEFLNQEQIKRIKERILELSSK